MPANHGAERCRRIAELGRVEVGGIADAERDHHRLPDARQRQCLADVAVEPRRRQPVSIDAEHRGKLPVDITYLLFCAP